MTTTPELHVYTYREGLLSAVGHDLRLRFDQVEVQLESGRAAAEVGLASVRVEGAMKRGRLDAGALSAKDRADIEEGARDSVFDVQRHPAARFVAEVEVIGSGRLEARGELTLHGQSRPWTLRGRVEGSSVVGEGELVPSHWGIKPFRALGGTLKVQDRVLVEVRLPVDYIDLHLGLPTKLGVD